jgi:hypothetical protein
VGGAFSTRTALKARKTWSETTTSSWAFRHFQTFVTFLATPRGVKPLALSIIYYVVVGVHEIHLVVTTSKNGTTRIIKMRLIEP